ncbi:hypothetical protein [Schumannella soli]|uniref:Uncharacterized protein n=1 Tax=Schumannella soli TaxID=2590779 RepID=A0A506YAR1_9MICO|nr:hypothetical protein [Schumannella soli]TPW77559.1 hypothetical protein FJ657_02450 [Schumannella soli]
MARSEDPIAQWMVDRVHELGRCSRVDLLADVVTEFGPRAELERPLMNSFRFLHRGTIRWIPAGAYWQSNLVASATGSTGPRQLSHSVTDEKDLTTVVSAVDASHSRRNR